MSDPQLRNIVNELIKLNQKLDRMNTNHVEIGRLFKTWLETEPEEFAIEEMDREPFVVGQVVRVTNIGHPLYKYIGEVVVLNPSSVQVEFDKLGEKMHAYFSPSELEILLQPDLHKGDMVRVIDPSSMVYNRVGKVIDPAYTDTTVEVGFGSSAGGIERKHLELYHRNHFEVDDIVRVTEQRHQDYDMVGTVIGVRKNGEIRVLFAPRKGYTVFTAEEITKIGEQPYKETDGYLQEAPGNGRKGQAGHREGRLRQAHGGRTQPDPAQAPRRANQEAGTEAEGELMLILNVPVFGAWFRKQHEEPVKIGTAEVTEKSVTITLKGETLEKLLELVEDGAEIRAFHVNVELQAARRKEN